jgi:hypothetical protein
MSTAKNKIAVGDCSAMLRQALAADEAQTPFTLSAFFIGFGASALTHGSPGRGSRC